MTLRKELLDILCCPKCKGTVVYDAAASSLTCNACDLVYPVKDDIPMMRAEDARPRKRENAR